jgi:amidase
MTQEIWRWSASQIAEAIKKKEISSCEAVEAHLSRIAEVNSKVNAIVLVLEESALTMAEAADRAVATGDELGPLHGVPITIKENIDLFGSATTHCVPAFAQAVPPVDAPHVAHMKKAGAIPIGRTNLPDFGLRWHTDNELHGPTLNPWDPALTPGGSSGGEAVALATGMSPLGIGNDYGGSLRWPSQCSGTAAIRPTLGRVPSASSLAPVEDTLTLQMFAVQGPMARHVADLRLALQVMSQGDPRDPWWVPVPLNGPMPDGPLKVAVTKDPGNLGVDPAVAQGIDLAAQALVDAGYVVEEVDPPLVPEAHTMWSNLAITEIYTLLLPMIQPIVCADSANFLAMIAEDNPILDLQAYAFTFADRNRIAREWSLFLAEYPIVIGPVTSHTPPEVGFDLEKEPLMEFAASLRLVTTANLLGLPAAVVSSGVIGGLPQSVQVIGRRYREDLCLDAAELIEQSAGNLTPINPS